MKRWLIRSCAVLVLILSMFGYPSWAQAAEGSVPDALLQESGAAEVTDVLDWDAQRTLEELGLSAENPEGIVEKFTLSAVWDMLTELIEQHIAAPLQLLAGLLAVILFASLLSCFHGAKRSATEHLFEYVCTLAAVTILTEPLCRSFSAVESTLRAGAEFMMAFVPVFAGILAVGGTAGSAVCYQTCVIALADGVMQLICRVLLPLCTMSFALAIVDAVNPSVSVSGLLGITRKAVTWSLGLLMSVFLGVLSLQNWMTGSVDTAATKTTKYVISNFVPVVGGAVSDAYTTVRGSLQILRSATGVIGIASLCVLFLPPLVQLLLYRGVVSIGAAVAELFGAQRLTKLLKGTQQALAIAFALLVCFGIMFVVATAIAVTFGKGSV